jgi:hypothetical protein
LAHHSALAVEQMYATSGDDPNVQRAAASAVSLIQSHLAMADRMATSREEPVQIPARRVFLGERNHRPLCLRATHTPIQSQSSKEGRRRVASDHADPTINADRQAKLDALKPKTGADFGALRQNRIGQLVIGRDRTSST